MIDPIGAFEEVREKFILYIKTAFGTQFPGLELERERLLRDTGTKFFSREPWIEPLARYQGSGKTIQALGTEDAPGLTAIALTDFKTLAACGLVGDYELHRHQVEMLQKSLSGKNAVVTSGTGSGKTEAFMLPLFAYLADESQNWTTPNTLPPHWGDWWFNKDWQDECGQMKRSCRVPQRGHETRDPAVRALILYPMNALVEDQMTRLRRALDSDATRSWLAAHRRGNRIYFGRYNGNTPVPGHELNPPGKKGNQSPARDRINKLAQHLVEMDKAAEAATKYVQEAEKQGDRLGEGALYYFARPDGAEMRSRWDMQDAPPDILITNYSMLSIMMMRDADAGIFEKTKQWLKKDGSVFHLVIDELHVYRGTAGTEVAYLLRLLLLRLGLTPSSPKLRILASSASLEPDDPESLKFLSEFFGVEWEPSQIVPGYPKPLPEIDSSAELSWKPFAGLANAVDRGSTTFDLEYTNIANSLGFPAENATPIENLQQAMEARESRAGALMLAACKRNGETRAIPLPDFGRGVFGKDLSGEDRDAAVRGLLIARGLCDKPGTSSSLPAFRFHWFFRNIEGLWSCTMPGCQCLPDEQEPARTAGKLFGTGRINCGATEPHRVLELMYCEQCGTTFFAGARYTLENNGGWELLSTDPDIEGIPDRQSTRFVDRRRLSELALFWPNGESSLHAEAEKWKQPSIMLGQGSKEAKWYPASLNTRSARVEFGQPGRLVPHGDWVPGYLFHLPGISETEQEFFSALASICPNCGIDYSRRTYRKSPIRSFHTGYSTVGAKLSSRTLKTFDAE